MFIAMLTNRNGTFSFPKDDTLDSEDKPKYPPKKDYIMYYTFFIAVIALCSMMIFIPIMSAKQQKVTARFANAMTARDITWHDVRMVISDNGGFPIADSQFYITILVARENNKVDISFPSFGFQMVPNGGSITSDLGALPENICPSDVTYRGISAPSNNGATPFWDDEALQPSLNGYMIQITPSGNIWISASGKAGNLIPEGPHNVVPTTIT